VPVNRASGTPTSGDTEGALNEAFISGTQPGSASATFATQLQ